MNATVQPGGCSPKSVNGLTSALQLKPSSDSVPNNVSFPSQVRRNKRECGDQGSEPAKRERIDRGHSRPERSFWKYEISKFTEKGGLVDSEGVEKLVQLMLPERNAKKIGLVGRSILAEVVAATDKFDCLNQFVQLRGLLVFDEWLQEVHKGKISDSSSKDSDKSIEKFLLVLLRALDKLPVNLLALQLCNIGKSVNHLRQHKNSKIQKKARSLVDTWKKRVETEMDAKSDSDNGGVSGSEDAMKSSVSQISTSRMTPAKLDPGETVTKSASVSPGTINLAPFHASVRNNLKERQPRNVFVSGVSDIPLAASKDERSSCSTQSPNNSQSCSTEHARSVGFAGNEGVKSSSAGSLTANKVIGGSSRQCKSSNGLQGPAEFGVQKETGLSRIPSLQKNAGPEKLSHSNLTCEKAVVPISEGNSDKLIVRIPSSSRSPAAPAQSTSGGVTKDPLGVNSRASSPVLLEKHDQLDCNLKGKSDACKLNATSEVNIESWQSNDFREVLSSSDEGDGSATTVTDEDHCMTGEDTRKLAEVSKAASLSSGNEQKSGKLDEPSFSSINALIESFVKYSEANASVSAGDDVEMKLFVNVADGEMSKSDKVSPHDSLQNNTHVVIEHSSTGSDIRAISSPGDEPSRDQRQSVHGVDEELEKRNIGGNTSLDRNTDGKTISYALEKPTAVLNAYPNSSSMDVQSTGPCPNSNEKSEETVVDTSAGVPSEGIVEKTSSDGGKEPWEQRDIGSNANCIPNAEEKLCRSSGTEDEVNVSDMEVEAGTIKGSSSYPSSENDAENKKNMSGDLNVSVLTELKLPLKMHAECAKGTDGKMLHPSDSAKDMDSGHADEVMVEGADEANGKNIFAGKPKIEQKSNTGSAVIYYKGESTEPSIEDKQVKELYSGGPVPHKVSPSFKQETNQQIMARAKLTGIEADESTSTTADASSSAKGGSDLRAKVEFDLNEGFNSDSGKSSAPAYSAAIQLIDPFPVAVSSMPCFPASITMAAAAKEAFVPPEDILKNKEEPGWKGSAATSAFRPAELRKMPEMLVCTGTTNISLSDATASKPIRPLLNIDLNVPNERILEDLASRSGTDSASGLANNLDFAGNELMGSAPACSSGGLDLDLNRADELADAGSHLTINGHRLEFQVQPVKLPSGGHPNGEVTVRRNFDLNDGPFFDETSAEPSLCGQHNRNGAPCQPSVSGLWMHNTEMGTFSSWFPQGNPYHGVAIHSVLPDRGEQPFSIVAPVGPQRTSAPPTGSTTFNPDVYRGPVMPSSPAVPFLSKPFRYPVFPLATNFSLPAATVPVGPTTYVDSLSGGRLFSAGHSQVLSSASAVPSQYLRPFAVGLSDNSSSGCAESSRKWARQGLDLNAGPLGPEVDGRDDTSSLAPRQLFSSQPVSEEQSRMYQVAGSNILGRSELEGGGKVINNPHGSRNS